jgi:hypothetical protein
VKNMDSEIEKSCLEMSYNCGKNIRQMMLDAGMTEEEIKKCAEDLRDNTYINGVPLSAEYCTHCEGRGWNSRKR